MEGPFSTRQAERFLIDRAPDRHLDSHFGFPPVALITKTPVSRRRSSRSFS